MSEANVETVKQIYEAFGRGDVPFILDQLADDVDWAADAQSDVAPWYGRRAGKDAVPGFFAGIGESLDVTELTPLAFGAGENDVFVFMNFGFTVKATGKSGSMHLHHYWRFDDDGKIAYYRGSEDTELTAALLRA